MSFKNILYEVKNRIAYLTINRPNVLNALNSETFMEIKEAMKTANEDAGVVGVIVTGAGEKSFVAGADIGELSVQTPVTAKEFALRSEDVLCYIERMHKPVIAAVNGFALGGGCEFSMACHMRVASENAKFGQPEVNLGLIAGNGGTQRLPRLVGKGRAIEMLCTGDMISAEEAYRIGLANRVVKKEDLLSTCEKILTTVGSKAPVAVKLTLEAVHDGMEMTLAEGLNFEANLFGLVFSTEDMKEGTKAFLEKRKANFQGK
ncbi:MAG: enoyl-CoA hydratase/isomerase family protein [Bacteroidetes bacterium]|nr:enoyl-CoA hydratase/isomerase family protein [Bacteroidota bacterium]